MRVLLWLLLASSSYAQMPLGGITGAAGGGPACGTYTHYRVITIAAQSGLSGDLTNYPVLISGTYTYLKTVGNGGLVQSSSGFDIAFYTDNTCTTKLNWEVETWTAASGVVNYWVQVPTLSKTVSTTFVLAYDNAAITTDQSNKTGTWISTFKGVWHLPDGSTLSGLDSTSNANNTTQLGTASAIAGEIDGGAQPNGTLDIKLPVAVAPIGSAWSSSVWALATSLPNSYNCTVCEDEATTTGSVWQMLIKSTGKLAFYTANSSNVIIDYDGTGSHTLSTGTWYLLAMTYSSSAGLVGYVNGAVDGTASANGNLVAATSAPMYLGFDSIANRAWVGKFDETRIANTALSADWILTDYNSQSSPATFYSVGSQF